MENYRDTKVIDSVVPNTKTLVPTHWKTGHLITEEDWEALKGGTE